MIFTYPNYGTPSAFPELKRRSGQPVTVLGPVPDCDAAFERMFRVRFEDGFTHDVFESELTD